MKKVLKIVGRVLLVLLVTVVIFSATVYFTLIKVKNGPSEAAKNLLITTLMETGQLKFMAHIVCSQEEIDAIVKQNAMQKMDSQVDTSLIVIGDKAGEAVVDDPNAKAEEFDENGIRMEEVSGRSFYAKVLIIKDPSQVKVGSIYPWAEYGKELHEIVEGCGAVAAVNGGLYVSTGNAGGSPLGVVVQDGEITYNNPSGYSGLQMIGFNNDNILIIKDIEGMSAAQFRAYAEEEGIRDAVAFQDEASDANNHFVSLIINGEARQLGGQGSGANPRTAIGQRADGAVILVVTDGRGKAGHLGATAADLISVMQEFGAVNAANLDGGSSSSMYYNGQYEMTSVTFYYSNSSWRLPDAFVVMPKED